MDKLIVLQVIGPMVVGGRESFLMNTYRNIDRNIIQFDFLNIYANHTTNHYDHEIRFLGGDISQLDITKNLDKKYIGLIPYSYRRTYSLFNKLRKYIRKNDYKVIHIQSANLMTFAMVLAAKFAGAEKIIIHAHSSEHIFENRLVDKIKQFIMINCATKRYACSHDAGIAAFGKGVDFEVLHNGIPCNEYIYNEKNRIMIREELNLTGKLVLGHISRFDLVKNHVFLIQVFARIIAETPDSVLLLVGDGEERSTIEEEILRLGLKEHVILTGMRSDTNRLLCAMDMLLLPSFHEGLPLVLIEAQATGLTCIASTGVPKESNLSGLVHFLPLEDGPASWAKYILDLNLSHERTQYNTKIVNAEYDASSTAKKLEDYYLNR